MVTRNINFTRGSTDDIQRAYQLADALTVRALKSRNMPMQGSVQATLSPWEGVAQLGEALIARNATKHAEDLAAAQREQAAGANDALIRQIGNEPEGPRRIEMRSPMANYGQPTGDPVPPMMDFETGRPGFRGEKSQALAAAIAGLDPVEANRVMSGAVLTRQLTPSAEEEAYTLAPGQVRYKGREKIAELPAEPEKEPDSVRKLRILLADPTLMAAERELAAAGGTNVKVQTGPYDTAWDKASAEADVKTISDARAKADSARGALGSLERLKTLNPGTVQGGTAAARVSAANFLNGLGMNIDPKLAASQEFDAIASRMVIDSLGGSLGTGFSNADRDFVQKTVPQIGHSMAARTALINFLQGKFQQQITDYNSMYEYAQQNKGLRGYNPNPRPKGTYDPTTGTIK